MLQDLISQVNDLHNCDLENNDELEVTKRVKRRRKLLGQNDINEQHSKTSKVVANYKDLISSISSGDKLGDEHVNAGNQLLRNQYPEIQGLCTPVLGQKLCFPEFNILQGYAGNTYLQVLHTGADHWITIEILSEEEVRLYDSIFLKPTYHTLKQIASIVKSKYDKIQISLAKVQFQKSADDCGVYALAFLADLCHGVDPNTRDYANGQQLRKHLIHCFRQGTMLPFPSTAHSKPERPLIISLQIYCSCRMPFALEHFAKKQVPKEEDTGMIQCDFCNNWYHHSCVKLSDKELQKFSYMDV